MDNFNKVLEKMDFEFLSNGKHSMGLDAMKKVINDEHFLFLDIRSEQEVKYLALPFMTHIPMHDLPARINELDKNKCVVTFCSSIFRASIVYAYLLAAGFNEVKCLTAASEDVASVLKPGFVGKLA